MDTLVSQKKIGQRVTTLRKQKGLSQADLALRLGISRPSLAQIELGNRSVDVLELKKLSMILGFSLDQFMADDFNLSETFELKSMGKTPTTEERISTPEFQADKFKNVLLYILEKCAGKPNVGEDVLSRMLYFADFNYYELYEEHLSGSSYHKLPYGPVPQSFDSIINQMIDAGQIQRFKTEYHGVHQTRYLPLTKARLTEFKASEKDVIDKVIEQMGDWSAIAISNYSHKDMPWMASKDGEEINYELAFYRDAPFTVRNYGEEVQEQ